MRLDAQIYAIIEAMRLPVAVLVTPTGSTPNEEAVAMFSCIVPRFTPDVYTVLYLFLG